MLIFSLLLYFFLLAITISHNCVVLAIPIRIPPGHHRRKKIAFGRGPGSWPQATDLSHGVGLGPQASQRASGPAGGWIEGYWSRGVPHGFQREFGPSDIRRNKKMLKFVGRYYRGAVTSHPILGCIES